MKDTTYKEQTKDRVNALKTRGIRTQFIALASGLPINCIYSLTKDVNITTERLQKINAVCDKLENILNGKEV